MKRTFFIFFCLLFCLTNITSCSEDCSLHIDENEDGICDTCNTKMLFIYKLTYNKKGYELDRVGAGYIGGDIVIPSEYNGLPVVEIGYDAFESQYKLTSVIIPDTVTVIGDDAFENQTSLTSINVGNGVITIGTSAFEDCTSLKSVIISDATEHIHANAFKNCKSLETITIGKNVKEIMGCAFEECVNLKTISIPSSIQKMGAWVFLNTGLTDIYFGVDSPGKDWSEKWNTGLDGVNIHWSEMKK